MAQVWQVHMSPKRGISYLEDEISDESDLEANGPMSVNRPTETADIPNVLAYTESETWVFAVAGLGMVVAGAATLSAGRRRRDHFSGE